MEGLAGARLAQLPKRPVANRDLWEPLVDLVLARGDITFRWVKGHSGDPMNDLVDALAVAASHAQTEEAPAVPPTDLVGGRHRPLVSPLPCTSP